MLTHVEETNRKGKQDLGHTQNIVSFNEVPSFSNSTQPDSDIAHSHSRTSVDLKD